MSSNKIAYSQNGVPLTEKPHYRLAKGGSAKPYAMGTCDISTANDGIGAGIQNYYVLAHMKPVARVKSRHRVSPSPRKIPNYEMESIIDKLAVLNPIGTAMGQIATLSMIMMQRNHIRSNLPRFR